jgi:hypothetical protein
MANDRIIIRCRHCKAERMFAKFYPGSLDVRYPAELAGFVSEHGNCAPNSGFDLGGDRRFDLSTENGS